MGKGCHVRTWAAELGPSKPRIPGVSANRDRLDHCLAQAADDSLGIEGRLAAINIGRQYLEGLTREMVDEAREAGQSWDDLAEVFGTSAQNLRSRFGSYRQYDD